MPADELDGARAVKRMGGTTTARYERYLARLEYITTVVRLDDLTMPELMSLPFLVPSGCCQQLAQQQLALRPISQSTVGIHMPQRPDILPLAAPLPRQIA